MQSLQERACCDPICLRQHHFLVFKGGTKWQSGILELKTVKWRAVQIFSILVGSAHRRETLTYNLLAKMIGYKGAGVLDRQLGMIMNWCADNDLPPLTVLVVNSQTGLPGPGLTRINEPHSDRELVFNLNWYDVVPPSLDDLYAQD